ncbi:hypothetical protein [Xanthomonas arboricola]|uniref:hypothetical protein n=1 Tax=Xanthomonas arboricola TaxID=56448 RepID=UPI001611B4E0|nr:hypothetical protein [Xanthomonas arboricola]MBB4726394.1 hypothetical protein [Xanthomonas arboricola]
MKMVTLGGKYDGVFNHVRYEAKSAVRTQGGYKAGYRLNDGDWNWSAEKYDDPREAVEAAKALAREAISMGEQGPQADSAN